MELLTRVKLERFEKTATNDILLIATLVKSFIKNVHYRPKDNYITSQTNKDAAYVALCAS